MRLLLCFGVSWGILWLLGVINASCYAQCATAWPADSVTAREARTQIALLNTAVQSRDYTKASRHLNWLIERAPRADSNLYITGAGIYDALLARERREENKRIYLDSLVWFYHQRQENCDKKFDATEAELLARYRTFVEKQPELIHRQLDSLLQQRQHRASYDLVRAYMESVRIEFRKYGKLNENQVFDAYRKAIHVAELKLSDARRTRTSDEPSRLLMDDIDAITFSMIVLNCDFIKKLLAPRFNKYPDDIMLARKIISLMLQNQCINDPLWLRAAERIYTHSDDHDYSLAKSIGIRYFNKKQYKAALPYLKDAVDLATRAVDRAEMLLLVGQIEARTDKAIARETYRQVIAIDKDNREAFERIGDLYYNSDELCKGEQPLDQLLVFMIAADYYKRATNGPKFSMAREKFPTREQLAEWGYAEGQTIEVACWIQEETTIQSKN